MYTGETAIRIAIIIMIDAVKLLRLQSWLSPAFPTGGYSYSHALEWAVEAGAVHDRASLLDWLDADMRHGSGRNDAIFFASIHRALSLEREDQAEGDLHAFDHEKHAPSPQRGKRECAATAGPIAAASSIVMAGPDPAIQARRTQTSEHVLDGRVKPGHDAGGAPSLLPSIEIAALAAAMRGTAEFALESAQQGAAFLSAVRKAWPHPRLDAFADGMKAAEIPAVLPIAAGAACAAHGISLELALPMYLQSVTANLVHAAMRLIPLGQTDGQIAVAALEGAVAATAAEALVAKLDDLGSAAHLLDIASMRHETQYTRLFRS